MSVFTSQQIVFIDASVSNADNLLADIDPSFQIIRLNGDSSALSQMATTLQGQTGIEAIHLISHGSAGVLSLSSGALDIASLSDAANASALQVIQDSLSANADLLIYGCDVAAGDVGQAFINALATATGADVGASTDATGSATLGGDWVLETSTGSIEAAAVAVANYSATLAPSISGLSNISFTENNSAVNASSGVTFSNGGNYGTGYLQFQVTGNGDTGDNLAVAAGGLVTKSGSNVYYNGTLIGTVDSSFNGVNGNALRINLANTTVAGSSPVTNGDFSNGLVGWNAYTAQVDLGVTQILSGYATPTDASLSYPTQTPGRDDNDLQSGYDNGIVQNASGELRLEEGSMTTASFGVVHGPAAYSDAFAATAGMVLKLDWRANYISDDYHVVAYLQNMSSGGITIAYQGYGSSGSGVASVTVPTSASYRFFFISGTFDASGGQAAGASMYIDNIRVESGFTTDAVVTALSKQITYVNNSEDPLAPTKTVTVSTKNALNETASSTFNITVTGTNDAPSFTSSAPLSGIVEDNTTSAGATVSSLFSSLFSDPDALRTPFDTLGGVVVVADASTGTQGTWQYTTDGTNWYAIGTVSTSSGLALASTASLRFVPAANWNGTPGALSVHAVDSSGGVSFTSGSTKNYFNTTTDGSTSAVSAAAVSITTSVSAVNDVPVYTTSAVVHSLVDTAEVDAYSALTGTISATDFKGGAPGENGTVSYSITTGTTSGGFSSVTGTYGTLALNTSSGAYTFNPNADAINALAAGTNQVVTYTVRASDGQSGTADQTFTLNITGASDRPALTSDAALSTIAEDSVVTTGQTVATLFAPRFVDMDAGASLGGIIITDNATTTEGDWEYKVSGSSTWEPVPTTGLTTIAGLALAATTSLRFVPADDYNGTPGKLTVYAADNTYSGYSTAGVPVANVDVTATGIGTAPKQLGITVTPVNDAPVLASDAGAATLGETAGYDASATLSAGSLTGTLEASDVDHASNLLSFGIRGGAAVSTTVTKQGIYGTLTLNSTTGAWSYVADKMVAINALPAGASVTDNFEFNVKDPVGATSAQALVITIQGTNDTPVLSHALATQSFSALGNVNFQLPGDAFTDAEGTALTYTVTVVDGTVDDLAVDVGNGPGVLPTWLVFNEAARTFTGTPPSNWVDSPLNLKVTASDGLASIPSTFTLTLTDLTNQAPVLNLPTAPQVVHAIAEVTSVTFAGSLGGTTLVFDTATVALGSKASAADVVDALDLAADSGAYTAAEKPGDATTLVLTATTPGDKTDFTDEAVVNLQGGSYTVNVVQDGQAGVFERVDIQMGSVPLGTTQLVFDTFTYTLIPTTAASAYVPDLVNQINANLGNWTAINGGGGGMSLVAKTAGDKDNLTTADFTVSTSTTNTTLVGVATPVPEGAAEVTVSKVEIDITVPQISSDAALFSIIVGGVVITNLDVSGGAIDGNGFATLLQNELRTADADQTDISVTWLDNVLTISDVLGRPISGVSLTNTLSSEIDLTPTITKTSLASTEAVVLTFAAADGATSLTFDGVTITLTGSETADQVASAFHTQYNAAAATNHWAAEVPTGASLTLTQDSAGVYAPNLTAASFVAAVPGTASLANSLNVTDGVAPLNEIVELTFTDIYGGQEVSVGGITATPGDDLTDEEVAAAVRGTTFDHYTTGGTGSSVSFTNKDDGAAADITADNFGGTYAGGLEPIVTNPDGADWTYRLPPNTFTDPEGNDLTYSAWVNTGTVETPNWVEIVEDGTALRFNSTTLVFSGDGSALPNGGLVEIRVVDAAGSNTTVSTPIQFTLASTVDAGVSAVNGDPLTTTWTGAGVQSYQIPTNTFAFADGGALTFSAKLADNSNLPAWLNIDPATGTFSGNPPANAPASLAIVVTASESTGASSTATKALTLTIASPNDAPVVAGNLPDVSFAAESEFSLNIGSALFSDPDGTAAGAPTTSGITYTATLADNSALPDWLHFIGTTFSGNPPSGTPYLNIKVIGTDAGVATASTTFTLNLTNSETATQATNNVGVVTVTGTPTQGQVLTAVAPTDADGYSGTVVYQWQVNSGSGWTDVAGSRGSAQTLTLEQSEVGQQIRVQAFYTDIGGMAESPVSTPALTVADAPDAGVVTFSATDLLPDETITALLSDADGLLDATPSYQWYRGATPGGTFDAISGATYASYTMSNADGGKYLKVVVTYIDDQHHAQEMPSAVTSGTVTLGAVKPVANDDAGFADEFGGVANGTTAANGSGNVFGNDTDENLSETHSVLSLRSGSAEGVGTAASSTDGGTTFTLTGQYGTLVVTKATGAWVYTVDQALTEHLDNAEDTVIDSFNYTNKDSGGKSDIGVLNITVRGANDAPVAGDVAVGVTEPGGISNASFNTPASGNLITGNATDVDGNGLSVASLRIGADEGSGASGIDSGTTLTYVGAYGTLVITKATGAYVYTVTNGATDHLVAGAQVSESFNYTVTDGTLSDTAVLAFTITGTNDAPVVASSSHLAEEDGAAISGTVSGTDLDGVAPTAFTLVTNVTEGSLNFNGSTGEWTFDPGADFQDLTTGESRNVTFTYTATDSVDGTLVSAPGTVTVAVSGVNDAPIVQTNILYQEGQEDRLVEFRIPAGTFTDADTSDTLTLSATLNDIDETTGEYVALPHWLEFDRATSTFRGTPTSAIFDEPLTQPEIDAGATQRYKQYFIRVEASDGNGGAVYDYFQLTITNANDTPVIDVAHTDASGNVIEAATQADGTVTANTATDSGTLAATDDDAGVDLEHGLTWNLVDSANANALVSTLTGTYGSITLNATTGAWEYTLDNTDADTQHLLNSAGLETFTARVIDNNGAYATQVITVNIAASNDSPVIAGSSVVSGAVTEAGDGVLDAAPANTASGTLNYSDDDGTTDTWKLVTLVEDASVLVSSLDGTYGSITLDATSGEWVYTLNNSLTATQQLRATSVVTETFNVQVADADGGVDTQTITITVQGTNDLPVISGDSVTSGSVIEAGIDGDAIAIGDDIATGTLEYSDADGVGAATWALVDGESTLTTSLQGTYGSITLNASTGAWVYTLDNELPATQALAANATPTETFNVRLTDDAGATVNSTIEVTVNGSNDAPAITNLEADQAGSVIEAGNQDDGTVVLGTPSATGTLTASDVDTGATQTWSVVDTPSPTYGSFAITTAGVWTYTLNNALAATQALKENESATQNFTVRVSDGLGGTVDQTVTVTITGTNDVPVVNNGLSADQFKSVTPASSYALDSNDVVLELAFEFDQAADAANLGISQILAAGGRADNEFDNAFQSASFSFATPGAEALFLFYQSGSAHLYRVINTTNTGTLNAADTIVKVDSYANVPVGSIDNSNFATLTGYNVESGNSGRVTEAGSTDSGNTVPGTSSATGTLMATDVDADATQTWSIVDETPASTYGTFAINTATGVWTYTLNNNLSATKALVEGESVTQAYTVRVTDDFGAYADQTVTVTINGTNDLPVITNDETSLVGSVTEAGNLTGNTVTEGTAVVIGTLSATDEDASATQIWSVEGTPSTTYGNFAIDAETDAWTYTLDNDLSATKALTQGQVVTQTYTARVTDNAGAYVDQTITVTINGTNDSPTVNSAVSTAITYYEDGKAASGTTDAANGGRTITALFGDVDSAAALSYSVLRVNGDGTTISTLPAWLSFSRNAGDAGLTDDTITFTTTRNPFNSEVGNYTLRVTADDGQGGTVFKDITIAVENANDAPFLARTIPDVVTSEGSAFTLTLPDDFYFKDIDTLNGSGQTLTYSAQKVDGQALSTLGWLTFDPVTRTFTGTPSADNQIGSNDIRVTVSDGTASIFDIFKITVTNVNDNPTGSPTIDRADTGLAYLAEGQVLSVNTSALVDEEGLGTLGYQWQIKDGGGNWVDISGATAQTLSITEGMFDASNATARDVRVTVSYTDLRGSTESVANGDTNLASAALSGDVVLDNQASSATPVIGNDTDSGRGTATARQGDTLSVEEFAPVDADGTTAADVTWTWARGGVAISGATGTTYTLTQADVGAVVTAVAHYIDDDGFANAVSSNATNAVVNINDAPVATGGSSAEVVEDTVVVLKAGMFGYTDLDGSDDVIQVRLINIAEGDLVGSRFEHSADAGETWTPVASGAVFLLADLVNVRFVSPAGYSNTAGDTVFQYKVLDVAGVESSLADFEISYTPFNDVPVVTASLALAADEDDTPNPTINLIAGASDQDGDELSVADVTYTVVAGEPSNTVPAGFSLLGNTLTVNTENGLNFLAFDEELTVVVSYNIIDGNGGSVAQTATITVIGTNDAPTVSAEITAAATEAEGEVAALVVNLLDNASDIDNGETATLTLGTITYTVGGVATGNDGANLPAGFLLTENALSVDVTNPAYDYLADGEPLDIVAVYTVVDAQGDSVAQTATITLTGSNDAPVAVAAVNAATEDGSEVTGTVTSTDVDVLGRTASYALVAPVAGLTLNTDGTYSFNPSNAAYQSLAVGEPLVVEAEFEVTDDEGATSTSTLTITVTGTNDAATISGVATATITENNSSTATQTVTGQLAIADIDSALTFVAQTDNEGTYGKFSVDAYGAWTYFTNDDLNTLPHENAFETFNVESSDGTIKEVSINLVNVNDVPVAINALLSQTVQAGYAFDWSYNFQSVVAPVFSDPDGDTLSFTATRANGTALPSWLQINSATGTLSGRPTQSDVSALPLVVKITASDAFGGSVDEYLDVLVTPRTTNELPSRSTVPNLGTTNEDTATVVSVANLLAGFTDTDLDTISIVAGSVTADHGTVVFNSGAQTYTITPAADYNGPLTLSYLVTDGFSSERTVAATANLTVTPVDDAPRIATALPDLNVTEGQSVTLNVTDFQAYGFIAHGFMDVEGSPLTYTAKLSTGADLPSWITFNGTTLTATPTTNLHTTANVRITATDTVGNGTVSDVLQVIVTQVNDAPTLTPINPVSIVETSSNDTFSTLTGNLVGADEETLAGSLSYGIMNGANEVAAVGGVSTLVGTFGSLTITTAGVWTYTPIDAAIEALGAGASPVETFTTFTKDVAFVGTQVQTTTQPLVINLTGANDTPVGSLTINGVATQGQTLTATSTIADADGMGALSYQWFANGSAIGGATTAALTLAQEQVGLAISVAASYVDGAGAVEQVASTATALVANANDLPTGAVTIAGIGAKDQVLTASNTLSDVDGLGVVSYQWMANGQAIAGATGDTFMLGQAQMGKGVTVVASFTDGFGAVESVASATTIVAPDGLAYIASYADLMQAFGLDAAAGAAHFITTGYAEGRSTSFDGLKYIASYADLIGAFGANAEVGASHYITNGFAEGRTASFDGLKYIASHADLIGALGANAEAGASHYITNGFAEGRTASFDGLKYIASHADLIGVFGTNVDAGVSHFITNGFAEGRTSSFDGLKYIASYADLIGAFGTNVEAGVSHFITNGLSEGRTASFDANDYLSKYADLRVAFGTDTQAAEIHFIQNGFYEGRNADLYGDDTLTGSSQVDVINGHEGNDVVYGAGGADTLIGGLGADQYLFNTSAESTPAQMVTIADFNSTEGDVINLIAVDADANTEGAQHFDFIGTAAFTGHAGELRFDTATQQLMADIHGDGQAAMQILLVGVTELNVASLMLV